MINSAVRNSIRGAGRQAYPHQAARALPRSGLLLYLGRPNLEAADVPLGDDTEIGDDTIIRWMFLLPADADIRSATGWVSGVGNIFYDAAGDPVAVLASEIAAWSSINQWNVLFHLVSADTETGRLAIYAVDTPAEILDRAMKVLRAPQPDLPSAFFNGMDFRLTTYTGGPTYVPDHLGVLRSPGANLPAIEGMRLATTVADGAVLGPELVVNGGFDVNTAGWTVIAATLSVVAGVLRVTKISANGQARSSIPTVAGSSYLLLFSLPSRTNTVVTTYCQLGSVAGSTDVVNFAIVPGLPSSSGAVAFTAKSSTTYIQLYSSSATGYEEWDNISIKKIIPIYINTDESGNAILPSTPQKTVTYNTDWTAKTFAETFDKFDISDPLKAPGWLCEPVKTNYALDSATPATHTTGTLAVGTYTLWQEGTGSIAATAGTAVGTFGTASNGTPATITITTAGTVVLTPSGTNTWAQLELGAFKTSRIYTTTAPVTRAATVASFPTAGKIPVNNFAVRMIVAPIASGQSSAYCFGTYIDSNNYTAIIINPTSVTIRKRVSGISNDASVSITHANRIPLDLILYSSPATGIQVAGRAFTSSWGLFTDGAINATEAAKANAQIASIYQLGSLNGSSQFAGNISLFDCVPIPTGITDPMAWAKTHWGVA